MLLATAALVWVSRRVFRRALRRLTRKGAVCGGSCNCGPSPAPKSDAVKLTIGQTNVGTAEDAARR